MIFVVSCKTSNESVTQKNEIFSDMSAGTTAGSTAGTIAGSTAGTTAGTAAGTTSNLMFDPKEDEDHDGILNADDNCVLSSNHYQLDSDMDGFGDECDNCPEDANFNQLDENQNDIGDVCERLCFKLYVDDVEKMTLNGENQSLDFSFVTSLSFEVTNIIVLKTCGSASLTLSDIIVVPEMNSNFQLEYENDFPKTINEEYPILVKFMYPDVGLYQNQIKLKTSMGDLNLNFSVRVNVLACPEPRLITSEINALPLDILTLDASQSIDSSSPDGKPVQYIWTVLSRPNGSTAQIVESFNNPALPADGGPLDNTSTPNALFFVDIAGDYIISLKVQSSNGLEAPSANCPINDVLLSIHAVPNEDLSFKWFGIHHKTTMKQI